MKPCWFWRPYASLYQLIVSTGGHFSAEVLLLIMVFYSPVSYCKLVSGYSSLGAATSRRVPGEINSKRSAGLIIPGKAGRQMFLLLLSFFFFPEELSLSALKLKQKATSFSQSNSILEFGQQIKLTRFLTEIYFF